MDATKLTEQFFDRIAVVSRLIDSGLPEMKTEIFGHAVEAPVYSGALSILDQIAENGMETFAKGMKKAGSIFFVGMSSDEEIRRIASTGVKFASIIKPLRDQDEILRQIRLAKDCGAIAIGCDIDHAYDAEGHFDSVGGQAQCAPKSALELKELVKASGELPFIVKGVLSVEDAEKCAEIGAKAIVVSSHHGILDSLVPPLLVLPEIRKAVGKEMTILADGSITNGFDAFKALSLGADGVLIGRALIPPLQENGADGVAGEMKKIVGQLTALAARAGYRSVSEIDDHCIRFL